MTNQELYHFGIKGQKWGRRRWQYEDGRFNKEGKIRYFGGNKADGLDQKRKNKIQSYSNKINKDINSFKPYVNTGVKAKNGKVLLTKEDVRESIKSLEDTKKNKIDSINAKYDRKIDRANYKQSDEYKDKKANMASTALKVGVSAAAVTLGAYGAYKAADFIREKKMYAQTHPGVFEKYISDTLHKSLQEIEIKDFIESGARLGFNIGYY